MRDRVGSIRVRTTAVAVLVVGVSLLVVTVAVVTLLDRSLRDRVRTEGIVRAEAIANALATGASTFTPGDPDGEFVQVLDADGNTVIASANVSGRPPLVQIFPDQTRIIETVPFEDEPFLVVATSVTGGPGTVIVGRSLESQVEARAAVIALLAVAMPILLLIVGAVTWWMVGRALAPVDSIRAEVEAISSSQLHRRVPDPPGSDEIARLATTMNRMLARLEEGHLRQRRFVSDASHELRSPVASIRQHAEVALSHPETTDTDELARAVLEEGIRLQGIVDDLLLLSSIDEGTLQIRSDPVDLDDVVFEEAARLRDSTDLRIDSESVSAARVAGDRQKLQRLVRNLVENAARHARATVALSLRETDEEAILTVEDDGEGVASQDRERIFERFVRLDQARDRDGGGSGIGLAIVREVAALHGGTVAVSDGDLGGARFEVRLPLLTD
jgi:signal transduction histidine kinase